MKYTVFYILILLIPMLTGCSSTSKQISLSRQIINEFSNTMKRKNNFTLFGLGHIGDGPEKLKGFVLRFTTYRHINVDQARELLISSCEQLLIQINANEKIRPWLTDYPYTGVNLDFMLSFDENEYYKPVSPPHIALASTSMGRIYYATHENDKFNNVHVETYEEALRIYHQNHCISD